MEDSLQDKSSDLETVVSLSFYGRDLDPDLLTQVLGCLPSETRRRGAVYNPRFPDRLSPFGAWHLRTRLSRTDPLESQILDILQQLPTASTIWQRLTGEYKARLFVGVFMNDGNEGFHLSPTLLARLAAYDLRLEFDIYAPAEE